MTGKPKTKPEGAPSFAVQRSERGGRTLVTLSGVIDEDADLSFFSELSGQVALHLGAIRRINSYGVRAWTEGIQHLVRRKASIDLLECPPIVIDQIMMVYGFLGQARVMSFQVDYVCPRCDEEIVQVLECAERAGAAEVFPQVMCRKCRVAMEAQQLDEIYGQLIREAAGG
jgi:hypothetical protein